MCSYGVRYPRHRIRHASDTVAWVDRESHSSLHMTTTTSNFPTTRRRWQVLAAATLSVVFANAAEAQGGMGGGGGNPSSTVAPAASQMIKRTAERNDPLDFLLDKKKQLGLSKSLEDTIKFYKKEMRHMQDVVFKDLDAAAVKKDPAGQPPGNIIVMSLTKDADLRVKDIQSAYRDRAHELLDAKQKHLVDSLEAVWKRDVPRTIIPPPPPGA